MIQTFGEDLRFLKEREDLHTLLGTLLDGRDMLLQMQSDSDKMHYALEIYKLLDKMIDKMGDVKDFGSKTVRDWTRIVSSCKNSLRRLIPGKQDDSTLLSLKYKNRTKPSLLPLHECEKSFPHLLISGLTS